MSRNILNRYKANMHKIISAYPSVFNKENPIPLAIGMQDLLLNPMGPDLGLSRTMIGDCLKVWTNRKEYHKEARKDGAMRYDLDLCPVEPVSKEDQGHAARAHDALRHNKGKLTEVTNQEPHSRLKSKAKKLFSEKVEKPLDDNIKACKIADTNKAITPPTKEVETMKTAVQKMQENRPQLAVVQASEKATSSGP